MEKLDQFQPMIIDKDWLKKSATSEMIFDNSNPLILDIGCGAGNFLSQIAELNKKFNFIGIDLNYKRLFKGARKVMRKKLDNVKLLRSKAEYIEEYFAENSLSGVFINFPDPWPKNKHRKNRLLSKEFSLKLYRLLHKSGFIYFKTDYLPYYKEVKEIFSAKFSSITKDNSSLKEIELTIKDTVQQSITSEFEDIFLDKQESIYSIIWRKTP
ncbi:MAG: tRNA (guanosine(46)-N7)-methyltransferase TrmB [SAR324 cluster bacterium]|nr:tRNA (guanosine(46)-N7)-methyltransferase TrmB [SAR324 cluster bacterium]